VREIHSISPLSTITPLSGEGLDWSCSSYSTGYKPIQIQEGLGTSMLGSGFLCMPRYFFHLVGDAPARDQVGHECESDKQATEDARLIAQRLSRERPEMFRDGNYICVTNEVDEGIVRVPLAFTTA
jgi:hypothetical protein